MHALYGPIDIIYAQGSQNQDFTLNQEGGKNNIS